MLLSTELPSFLSSRLSLSLSTLGIVSAIPYIIKITSSICFGWLFLRLERSYGWSTSLIRSTAVVISFLGTSGVIAMASFCPSDSGYDAVLIAMVMLAFMLYGALDSGLACAYSDLCPEQYADAVNTLGNMLGVLTGSTAPLFVALCKAYFHGVWVWRVVFLSTFVMLLVVVTIWLMMTLNIERSTHNPEDVPPLPSPSDVTLKL